MTQFEYELICKLIQSGAPALAEDLINGLANVINAANEAIRERDELKAEVERLTADSAEPETPSPKGEDK